MTLLLLLINYMFFLLSAHNHEQVTVPTAMTTFRDEFRRQKFLLNHSTQKSFTTSPVRPLTLPRLFFRFFLSILHLLYHNVFLCLPVPPHTLPHSNNLLSSLLLRLLIPLLFPCFLLFSFPPSPPFCLTSLPPLYLFCSLSLL